MTDESAFQVLCALQGRLKKASPGGQSGHGRVTLSLGAREARRLARVLSYLLDEAPEREELNCSLPTRREIESVLRTLFPGGEAGRP